METLMSILEILKAMIVVSFKFAILFATIVGFIEYVKEDRKNATRRKQV